MNVQTTLSANAMSHLHTCEHSNVLYLLSQALGTMRPDSSDSLLPAKGMPMRLIEYTVKFFTSMRYLIVVTMDRYVYIFV